MEWKTWIAMLLEPSHSMLCMRDRVKLLLASVIVSLLLVMLMALGGELFFGVDGDALLTTYGVDVDLINTVLCYFYLRAPLRQLGFIEYV
jgi:hypothetical protein